MLTVALVVLSVPGLLGTLSLVASTSPQSIPLTWRSEVFSPAVERSTGFQPAATASPDFVSIAPTSPSHPLDSTPVHQEDLPDDVLPTPSTFTLTVTETLIITVPASSSLPPEPTGGSPGSRPMKAWQCPSKMNNLSDFNILKFSGGEDNLEIVQGIPPSILTSYSNDTSASLSSSYPKAKSHTTWDVSQSAIQILYPEGSINPAQRPVGGAQFYAVPIDITSARSVSLEYSAFFPADFDWVLGGKMPGLYGGHVGCSGGSAALDCWSTRLMWRQEGKGELYLYAAKDKQTEALCNDPQSVCDATYGFSVGRGSYTWAAGAWTTVRQTVTLNTPGKQNGQFALDVNGVRVFDRKDIFYRGAVPGKGATPTTAHKGNSTGLVGGLLGNLVSDLIGRNPQTEIGTSPTPTPVSSMTQTMYQAQQGWAVRSVSQTGSMDASMSTTSDPDPQPKEPPSDDSDDESDEEMSIESQGELVGFTGLFFCTFFGGHEPRFASPKDQYAWFKDFSMSYNN
ncbi:hypothetical protein H0H92_015998 [Tricholoma furcatifolium]|nr:hypothetical protein H0H92_015998 [Tricholoma furcatifolium]